MNLKELERRVYLTYMDDGLLDIFVGWFLFLFSAGVAPGVDFPYFFLIAYLPFWLGAKRLITYPRIGKVEFSEDRKARMRNETWFFLLFFSATAMLGLLFFLLYAPGFFPTEVQEAVKGLKLVPMALIAAAALASLAYWKQLNRFYVYAILIAAMAVGGHALGAEPYLYFLIPSLMIGLAGISLLINFMQRYPLPKGGR
jgi:hypothetical protein